MHSPVACTNIPKSSGPYSGCMHAANGIAHLSFVWPTRTTGRSAGAGSSLSIVPITCRRSDSCRVKTMSRSEFCTFCKDFELMGKVVSARHARLSFPNRLFLLTEY